MTPLSWAHSEHPGGFDPAQPTKPGALVAPASTRVLPRPALGSTGEPPDARSLRPTLRSDRSWAKPGASPGVHLTTGASETPSGHAPRGASNDNCANATPIGEGTFSYDLAGATNDWPGSCGASAASPDTWYRYTASCTGEATISTCGLSAGDTVLAVLDQCGGVELACLDDSCGLQSQIVFSVTAGTSYSIRVAGYNGSVHAGQFSVSCGLSSPSVCTALNPATDCQESSFSIAYNVTLFSTAESVTANVPVNTLCIQGVYFNNAPVPDAWVITVYNDAGNLPGSVVDTFTQGVDLVVSGPTPTGATFAGRDVREWGFVFARPINQGNACFWYECRNLASGDQVFWLDGNATNGNRYGAQDLNQNGVYETSEGVPDDLALCINGGFANNAACFPGAPCSIVCPEGAMIEPEPCGADFNGGCDNPSMGITPIKLFQTVCGTVTSDTGFQDSDWYEFTVPQAGVVTWSVQAEFVAQLSIADATCPGTVLASGQTPGQCEAACTSAYLNPGTYRVSVRAAAPGVSCGISNRYLGTLKIRDCVVHPANAYLETEVCGDDQNGGCNTVGFPAEPIVLGRAISGTAWADGGNRDTDWYSFVQTQACVISVCGRAEFPLRLFLLDDACPPNVLATGATTAGCEEVCIYAAINPGSYRIFAAVDGFSDYPCGARNFYTLRACCPAFSCECDDEAAVLGCDGQAVLPADLDPNGTIVEEDVDMVTGLVSNLYPQFDTSVDTWYRDFPCDPAIGQDVPNEAMNPDLQQEMNDEGLAYTPAQFNAAMLDWEDQMEQIAALAPAPFATPAPASAAYTPPARPHCTDPNEQYVFGGRDIIFVHGLKLDHIRDRLVGVPEAQINWQAPTQFPGSTQNPEFYGIGASAGYFKHIAECTWLGDPNDPNDGHIDIFLKNAGFKNRYLIVSYPCTEHAEIGAQAVLTQIADAMRTGTGVVDLSGNNNTQGFGTPSFVIVSHSTGSLVSDIAMWASANVPALNVPFVAQHCKAHVALDGAFNGSSFATAALVVSGLISSTPITNQMACDVIQPLLASMTETFPCSPIPPPFPPCPSFFGTLSQSILFDLSPWVTQLKWGPAIRGTPVRAITVSSAHPTKFGVAKFLFHRGFDDGVLTMNSQTANPNWRLFWPNGFIPNGILGLLDYDLCLARHHNSRKRANRYFVDQVIDPQFNPLVPFPFCAAGAIPYVSPWGMVHSVANDLRGTVFSSLDRSPNHFSFLSSASDHFSGFNGAFDGFNLPFYKDTVRSDGTVERNWEETRVITDPAVYVGYSMPYTSSLGIDDQPLLRPACTPQVQESICGRKITFRIRIPFIGTFTRSWWIWKRTHHRLLDWQNKSVCEYVYRSVLYCDRVYPCPKGGCMCDWNGDGNLNSQDFFDFLTGFFNSSADFNADGLTNSQDFFDFLNCFFTGCP